MHFAGVGIAEQHAVEARLQLQMQASVAKRFAQLVRSDDERRERGCRLGHEKAKTFGELRRNQVAEGPIIGEHQEPHVGRCLDSERAAWGVTEHDAQLGLEIQTEALVAEAEVVIWTEQAARRALVYE